MVGGIPFRGSGQILQPFTTKKGNGKDGLGFYFDYPWYCEKRMEGET